MTPDKDVAAFRHQCEVRAIIRDRVQFGSEWAQQHMAGIEKKRGRKAMEMLMADIKAQWAAGNRGEHGDWRD